MAPDPAAGRFVRLATRAVAAYAVVLPLISLVNYLNLPRVQAGVVVLILCTVPASAWLAHAAAVGALGPARVGLLAVLVVVTLGLATVIGPPGWGQLYVPSALIATTLRPGWSVAFLVALMGTATPLAVAVGAPEYGLYYTLGVPLAILPLSLVVHLVRAVRRLDLVRQDLAREAMVRERLRIDADLRSTVGAALSATARQGEQIERMLTSGKGEAAPALSALSAAARRSLADARRLVRGYRDVSLRAELDTARVLLAATGIQARVEPAVPASGQDDEDARRILGAEVLRLLSSGAPRDAVVLPLGQFRLVVEAEDPARGPR